MRLELELPQGAFRPGEPVAGRVLARERGTVRSIEVLLRYEERTDDFGHTWAELRSGALHEGDLEPDDAVPFSVTLPPDAPPGCTSEFGDLGWEIEVRADIPGGSDTREVVAIEVAPRRYSGSIGDATG